MFIHRQRYFAYRTFGATVSPDDASRNVRLVKHFAFMLEQRRDARECSETEYWVHGTNCLLVSLLHATSAPGNHGAIKVTRGRFTVSTTFARRRFVTSEIVTFQTMLMEQIISHPDRYGLAGGGR